MKKEIVVTLLAVTTVVGVGLLVRHWKRRTERRWRRAQRILRKFASNCATPAAKLTNISNDLATCNNVDGTISHVHVPYLVPLPTGEEKGTYYGINFRGTNFLIVRAKLRGKNEPVSELQKHEVAIPWSLLSNGADSTTELFDFISLELAKFISLHDDSSTSGSTTTERKLGFTVSSVADHQQNPLASSKWSRLSVDETAGKELANEMNLALEKHGVHMRVLSVVSDSVGNLAGGRYYNKECVAAVTLGMRTDMAYIDTITPTQESLKETQAVINMQWGNFNTSHLPITEYDSLDAENTNSPSESRMFEKLVSGMYLGEIVRRVLLKMAHEASLFGDRVPPKLATPYILRSPDMAAMHQDTSEDYDIVDEKLKEIFEINNTTPMVRETVAEVCDVVAERGARLVGAGIVGIVKRLDRISTRKSIVIIEGGLYEHYRVFRNYIHSSVWEMLGSELSDNLIIEHAHGDSGAGSVFLAASQTPSLES